MFTWLPMRLLSEKSLKAVECLGDDDHQIVRCRKNKTIDCAARRIGFKELDINWDGIILFVNLVDSLNRVIFSVAGIEAIVLA